MSDKELTERRQFRARSEHRFTTDELLRAQQSLWLYNRHTVDISDTAPVYVEEEALAFERTWRLILLVLNWVTTILNLTAWVLFGGVVNLICVIVLMGYIFESRQKRPAHHPESSI